MTAINHLSTYFTWDEVCHSTTASRLGLDNTPPAELYLPITVTAAGMDKVRKLLNRPVIVTSWYRSPAVNKAVGSRSKKSQHTKGEAVDFICPAYGSPKKVAQLLAKNMAVLNFDQLIYEYDWIHISFSVLPRGNIYTLNSHTNELLEGIC